jgi:transposase
MSIVGGLDIHRKQLTFDYLDTVTGRWCAGRSRPRTGSTCAAGWPGSPAAATWRSRRRDGTGWRYVTEELVAAGVAVHLAESADTAFARGRKRHAKTDLLTELPGIAASQKAERSRRQAVTLSGMSLFAGVRY